MSKYCSTMNGKARIMKKTAVGRKIVQGNFAQSSAEFMIVLGLSIAFFIVLASQANESMNSLRLEKEISDADRSVSSLRDAVNEVYYQGAGARKSVFIRIPDGVVPARTKIDEKTITISVQGNDRFADTVAEMTGTIPTSPGGYWLLVEAGDGYVSIGDALFHTDKSSVYSAMLQGGSAVAALTITNATSGNIDVNLYTIWPHTNVALLVSPQNFTIPANEDVNVSLAFSSTASAVGNYVGSLDINAGNGIKTQSASIPLNAEIIITGSGGGGLFVIPSLWRTWLPQGGSDSNTLNVCNTKTTQMTNVTFTPSVGDAGDWISPINPITALPAETCQTRTVTMNVPGGAAIGTKTGTITVQSAEGDNDTVSLDVNVVPLQAGSFSFNWGTAYFSSNTTIYGFTIQNTGATAIDITRMTVSEWSGKDRDSALLLRIRLLDNTIYWAGTAGDGQEIALISQASLLAGLSYTQNELLFTQNVNNNYEQFRIQFTFSDGSTYMTSKWPLRYQVDLWELATNLPQPLDFTTDINSTANTFGIGAGNDGWDWMRDAYQNGTDCVQFNADPNYDGSKIDSTINSLDRIRIRLGDYSGACGNNGSNANGAYGVEFTITQEQYDAIAAGKTATFSFNWYLTDSGVDAGEAAWIKARIGNSGGMTYLGSSLDGGADTSNEIYYNNNPPNTSGAQNINVTPYITGSGNYYLDLGGKLLSWNLVNEDVFVDFDNIDLVIQ